MLGLIIGAALGILLYHFLYVKKVKDDIVIRENELSRLNNVLYRERTESNRKLSVFRQEVNALRQSNKRLLEENISLGQEIDRLRTPKPRMEETITKEKDAISIIKVSTPKKEPPLTLYADAIIDDYFFKVSEIPREDSVFVLHLDGDASAVYNIYEPAYQKIVANPSFLEGCEKQILGDTLQLEIVSEGKAQREPLDGKWKVINKLSVIIR